MADPTAREQSYIKALMYLGTAPKFPVLPVAGVPAVEWYQAMQEYDNRVYDYYREFVWETVDGTDYDEWTEGFHLWQRADARSVSTVHDEMAIKRYNYK